MGNPQTPQTPQAKTVPNWSIALMPLVLLLLLAFATPLFAADHPRRIVSLAPSVTEFLFALGAGDRVVGVTRYCDDPPAAGKLAKVGGYLDTNYEAIVSLRPDLVVLLATHREAREKLASLGVRVLAVDHESVRGILDSVPAIAAAAGADAAGEALSAGLHARVERVARKVAGRPRPRAMVVVGRNLAAAGIEDVYISGRDGYYDQLLALAGGENAYRDRTLKFPAVSAEGIIRLDPDFILEMISDIAERPGEMERALSRWDALSAVRAVREGKVRVFGAGYAVVPGPRFVLLLEEIARAIHPEVGWND
jgi:iron complex transport system substrate-binding protein